MDKGVEFAIKNLEDTFKIVDQNPQYSNLKKRLIREYYYLKAIKKTGNLYDHFLKFKGNKHKYANDFSFLNDYGIITNEKMADYLVEHFSDELNNFVEIEDLEINAVYSNNEIRSVFKCSDMGGMRRSVKTNALVLISKHNNPLYDDSFDENGNILYTGEGQIGDQKLEYRQNKTLACSDTNGVKIYFFESYKDNEYYYRGEVKLSGSISTAKEKDKNGNLRSVFKFPLKTVDNFNKILIKESDLENSEEAKIKEVQKLTLGQLREAAKNVSGNIITREVITTYHERSQVISEYIKNRASGICDLCGKEAPFKTKTGKPYLESHHVITLADGGPDVMYNAVALCPNCHRKMHAIKDKKDIQKLTNIIYNYLLEDNEKKLLEEFNVLFNKNT